MPCLSAWALSIPRNHEMSRLLISWNLGGSAAKHSDMHFENDLGHVVDEEGSPGGGLVSLDQRHPHRKFRKF
jgi:hypothetical protein